jgi:hypothetical protein
LSNGPGNVLDNFTITSLTKMTGYLVAENKFLSSLRRALPSPLP